MRENKAKYIAGLIIVAIMIVIAFRNIEFKSVDKYKEEQQQLAESGIVKDKNGNAQIIFEDGDKVSKEDVKEAVKDQKKNTVNKTDEDSKSSRDSKSEKNDTLSDDIHNGNEESRSIDSEKNTGENTKEKNTTGDEKKDDESNGNKQDTSSKKTPNNRKEQNNKTDNQNNKTGADNKDNKKSDSKSSNDTNVNEGKKQNDTSKDEKYIECSIEINCFELSDNPELMSERFREYIPSDGVVLKTESVLVLEGTTVYDILNAACKKDSIQLNASFDALYKSYYVRSICNLPEKAAGNMSGWVYTINGKSPMLGASSYRVSRGDKIVWSYTTDGVQ